MTSGPTTVLIVDDAADTRENEVDLAEDGVSGLEKAIATLPDVMVLDLTMPVLQPTGRKACWCRPSTSRKRPD